MSKAKFGKRKGDAAVVRLKDLAPPRDVKGGAGKLLFGERRGPANDAPKPENAGPSVKKTVNVD